VAGVTARRTGSHVIAIAAAIAAWFVASLV